MGGVGSRAIVLTIVFLLSSQFPFSNSSLNEEAQQFFTEQEVISSTEVRVHNLGGDWNENQVLEWSPNHLEYNRTIQFSILIEGINSTESIESMTLNMTWIYNVSTGDPLLSENLSISELETHENGLFMYYNYTYPLDIYHDEYNITLDVVDSGGILHTFEHKGINVIAYDMHLEPISIDFDSKLLFANNQVTSLELFIQNTGSVYTDIEFDIILLSQLPSNWNPPNIFISDSDLSGGQNSTALFEFQTPNDAYPSKDPMPVIEFQLIAEFEDFTGQMVEFYNANYSLEGEIVPFDSIANISAYRTNFTTDPIKNNYQQPGSDENILEYSLVSFENRSIEFFFEFENYGFTQSTFELDVVSQNSIEIEVFSQSNSEKVLDLDGQQGIIPNLEPFDPVYFRCKINFITVNEISKDPVSIIITNSNTGEFFNLDLPIYLIEVNNLLFPTIDLDFFEISTNLTFSQNDSFMLYLAIQWQNIFSVSYFENNWEIFLTVNNPNSVMASEIVFDLQENNSSITNPYDFSITENRFFSVLFNISEDIDIGNYSIKINLEQITDDFSYGLNYETILQLAILENTSLSEPNQNNSNNDTIIDDSNNNSTVPDSNNLTNNSTNPSENNNSAGTPDDDCTDILCEACPLGMVSDPDGDCCACMEAPETNVDNGGQNENSEPDDSTDSQSNDTKSWLYVSFILVLISLASIIIIRRKISSQNSKLEDAKDKTIVEINPPIMPALQVGVGNDEQLTVLHQWTDNNGYTWKQMSDRSMLWWNGQEWVPVNYN